MPFLKKFKRGGWTVLRVQDDQVDLVHIERGTDKPVVISCDHQTLDVTDAQALKAFALKHKLAARHCLLLLNRGDYRMIQTNAVDVPPAERKQAVRWAIKDMLEYPVSTATVDVLDVPADINNPSRQRFMLAIVSESELIRQHIVNWIDVAMSGLEVIDIPELGQRNLAACLEEPNRGLALLSFSEQGGLLTLSAGGELYYSLLLNTTLSQLQDPDEERRAIVYERVALDLQRTLDNFERQFAYVTVNRLLVAPFVMCGGMIDFLRDYLYLQVESFQLKDLFDLDQVMLEDPNRQSELLPLLGAALRSGL